MRSFGLLVSVLVTSWILFRHIGTWAVRGRVVAVTGSVLGSLVVALGLGTGLLVTDTATRLGVAAVALPIAVVLATGEWWPIFGTSSDRILDRVAFVARGLGFQVEEADRSVKGRNGTAVSFSLAASRGGLHLARLRGARRKARVVLFRQGVRKFLTAESRQRG